MLLLFFHNILFEDVLISNFETYADWRLACKQKLQYFIYVYFMSTRQQVKKLRGIEIEINS